MLMFNGSLFASFIPDIKMFSVHIISIKLNS